MDRGLVEVRCLAACLTGCRCAQAWRSQWSGGEWSEACVKVLSDLGFGDGREVMSEPPGRTGSCCVLSEDGLPWQDVLGIGLAGVRALGGTGSEDGFCAWWKARRKACVLSRA